MDESKRLKSEIDALQETAKEVDADGASTAPAIRAKERLLKLNDDYRALLVSIGAGDRAEANASATANAPKTADDRIWGPDPNNPNGPWIPLTPAATAKPTPPTNPDEDVTKAVARQTAEAQRNERQANEAAGKGYMTNAERETLDTRWKELGLTADRVKLERDTFEQNRKFADQKEAREAAQSTATVAHTEADTSHITAQTDLTRAQIEALAQKTGPEIAEMESRGELTKAQADQIRQNMNKPSVVDTGGRSTITTMGPNGQINQTMSLEYAPKTAAEIQARAGQIQAAATAKRDELNKRIGPGYTAQQALDEFNAWYDQNVEPQKKTLQAAQEDLQFQRGKDQAAMANSAMDQVRQAYTAQAGHRVGPGAAEAIRGANTTHPDFSSAVLGSSPDLTAMAMQNGAPWLHAIKDISPTAASAVGAGSPSLLSMDPAAGLDRTAFMPGGPPAAAPAAAPVAAGAPAGDDFLARIRARLDADVAQQRMQGALMNPMAQNANGPTAIDDPYGRLMGNYRFPNS